MFFAILAISVLFLCRFFPIFMQINDREKHRHHLIKRVSERLKTWACSRKCDIGDFFHPLLCFMYSDEALVRTHGRVVVFKDDIPDAKP